MQNGHICLERILDCKRILRLDSFTVKLGNKERFDKEQIGIKGTYYELPTLLYHKSTVG